MALDFVMPTEITIKVRGIDLLALKKLSLVSHALAKQIGGHAGREQACLAGTLDDLIREIELGVSVPHQGGGE
jgi:hypothetical protein